MHSIISTPLFLMQTKRAGVTESEMDSIISLIAANPEAGMSWSAQEARANCDTPRMERAKAVAIGLFTVRGR
ncbi:hypothetical protein [Cypionkella sp.]|uniref:hypothetical protein n=1 Tax=Cypionkella sp. TaxID=2811411 RepID=UPI00263633E8|nr:hypothetical protein [Cypionkella sp.]